MGKQSGRRNSFLAEGAGKECMEAFHSECRFHGFKSASCAGKKAQWLRALTAPARHLPGFKARELTEEGGWSSGSGTPAHLGEIEADTGESPEAHGPAWVV